MTSIIKEIKITRRVTTPFLEAIPPQVSHFDAYIYAVVKRKNGLDIPEEKYGIGVRIDPAILNWDQKTITAIIPYNINTGIKSIDDLEETWFESLEAAFLMMIHNSLP
jgi:hypothetical protein